MRVDKNTLYEQNRRGTWGSIRAFLGMGYGKSLLIAILIMFGTLAIQSFLMSGSHAYLTDEGRLPVSSLTMEQWNWMKSYTGFDCLIKKSLAVGTLHLGIFLGTIFAASGMMVVGESPLWLRRLNLSEKKGMLLTFASSMIYLLIFWLAEIGWMSWAFHHYCDGDPGMQGEIPQILHYMMGDGRIEAYLQVALTFVLMSSYMAVAFFPSKYSTFGIVVCIILENRLVPNEALLYGSGAAGSIQDQLLWFAIWMFVLLIYFVFVLSRNVNENESGDDDDEA